jgi:hypothetical protein
MYNDFDLRLMDRSHPVMLKICENFRLRRREKVKHEDIPPEVEAMCRPLEDNIVEINDLDFDDQPEP